MADLSPGAITRKARTKGGIVTIVTVLSLVAAMGLTWFGLSANDQVSANYDASAWLWSLTKGELARVNGLTGKVDTRSQALTAAQGHFVQVNQSDRYLIVRDESTGRISAIDPATLQITAQQESQQGLGVTIALQGPYAFIIDPVQGVVSQLDPATLQPIGEELHYPPGITGGVFDGEGRLWIAVPSQGTVSAITPAKSLGTAGAGGAGGGSPSLVRTEAVASPSHDLALSVLDNGVAVLDQTTGTLTTVRGTEDLRTVTVDQASGGIVPGASTGPDIPVTVGEGRHVYVITGDQVREFTVPGTGDRLRAAVPWAGRFYVADDLAGAVYVLDGNGNPVETITFKQPGGPLELEVRENHLFINAPGSSTARVVDEHNQIKVVEKFARDVLGAEPPPAPVTPPPPKPTIGKPGSPRNVTAAAGDKQVRLSWGKAPENGSKITKYVISWPGLATPVTVGANQRTYVATGLVNGQTYTFSVHAVNGKGAGPDRRSNAVMPTGEVPDAPTAVTAEARNDGTVDVSWPAANGQGRKITRYEVTAVSGGSSVAIGTTTGAVKLTIADGELDYGTQYAFTVVAVNDKGAGSQPSPASDTVVPFNKPGKVGSLSASTVGTAKGTIRVTWGAPAENGRPIEGYKVTAGGKTQTVTGTSVNLNGFGDGEVVTVEVAAVNEAGTGAKDTTSAKTIAAPAVSNPSTSDITYNSLVVHFAYDDGGGSATCTLTVNGADRGIGCNTGSGGYTVSGLSPGNAYTWTVTITNDAGNASTAAQRPSTPDLGAWARCSGCGDGVWAYKPNGSGVLAQDNGCCAMNKYYSHNTQVTPICWYQGGVTANSQNRSATLNSAGNNGNKKSDKWIKVSSTNYLPFAFVNLESSGNTSNNYDLLPQC
ncbi:fibronectin type III domain-containing protein [Catellatospora sp. KI3]|uniref:fibronectin type III domain-containing protein n=1 Tax=Catellatospora sp. KI3 TaxID=3041620 RepID=UPI0024825630|nr:fibronectin type III domain-containing protein [Catellatospora sp. KI3]MDI1462815.1 fibronectin type III domain-containing protein [Catellatospora sp. KI3]